MRLGQTLETGSDPGVVRYTDVRDSHTSVLSGHLSGDCEQQWCVRLHVFYLINSYLETDRGTVKDRLHYSGRQPMTAPPIVT